MGGNFLGRDLFNQVTLDEHVGLVDELCMYAIKHIDVREQRFRVRRLIRGNCRTDETRPNNTPVKIPARFFG